MAILVAIMAIGGGALISDHVSLVDQRDTLKEATNAAGIAATQEMKQILADDPNTSDDDLVAALKPLVRGYIIANLQHLSGNRYERAVDTLFVEVLPDRIESTVDVNAQADLGGFLFASMVSFLGGVSQIESMNSESRVQGVTNPVEVVLALDISASMDKGLDGRWTNGGPDSRMEIVKRAAKDLVAILNPNEENRVAVGMVPWHILVRLGDAARQDWDRKGWAKYPSSRHYAAAYASRPAGSTSLDVTEALPADPGEVWKGCLDEHRVSLGGRAALPPPADLLDQPSESAFAQAIFPASYGVAYQCLAPPLPSNFYYQICYDEVGASALGRTAQAPQRYCDDETAAMLPLTSDRAAIEATIDSLTPVGFRTYSTLGVLWGQRLLLHSWQSMWGGDVHPVDPNTVASTGARKAIVLLTDGEDNPCGLHDPICSTNDVGYVRDVACMAAKAQGTEIFVIAAMHPDNVPGSLGTALRACSSESDNPEGTYVFLENSDVESLRTAFTHIANQLVTIRRIY